MKKIVSVSAETGNNVFYHSQSKICNGNVTVIFVLTVYLV